MIDMTIRFKKVRNFDRIRMIQDIEKEMMKDDLDDIYMIDNRESEIDSDDVLEHAFMQGYMSA